MVSNNNGSILILGVLIKNTISTPKTKSHLYFVAQKKKSLILGLKKKKKKKKRSYSRYFFSHHSTTYHTSYHRKKKKKKNHSNHNKSKPNSNITVINQINWDQKGKISDHSRSTKSTRTNNNHDRTDQHQNPRTQRQINHDPRILWHHYESCHCRERDDRVPRGKAEVQERDEREINK